MEWCKAHNEDDTIPHSRTEGLMDSTLVLPSMSSTYSRINWIMLPAYRTLQNIWHNYYSAPTPLMAIPPPIFLSLISSRSFIFCTIPELVVTDHLKLAIWPTWWIWICPSPPYMVTPLLSLVWSRTFYILAWMRLTSIVLYPPIWTTYSRSNSYPSNHHIILHSFMISQVLPQRY